MNIRHLTLPLAVSLALASPCVSAMGLGQLQVKSGLYQPLVAEIPIISATPSELDQLDVRLASPEAFSRIGLERPTELTANLQFSVGKNASGQPVILVTTPSRFSEPLLSFLIEASWGKGTVTREYTALIDPPYIAPAVIQPMITPSIAAAPAAMPAPEPVAPPVATVPAPEPEPAQTSPVAEPEPTQIIPEPEPQPIAQAPAPAPRPAPRPAPPPAPAPRPEATSPTPQPRLEVAPEPTPVAQPGQIGPISPGQTLWSIASSSRPDPGVSVNQMMLALLRANPEAFDQDNINRLKSGSVLRVPGQDEINRLSPEAAAALVSQQAIAWRSPRQPVPQPEESSSEQNIASTPAEPKPTPPAQVAARPARPSRPSSRLEIVPPSGNSAARGAQSGAAAGAGGTELRAELAQAREDLAARTSEVTELKSRVAELEKQDSDRQRLIEMQNSQLKELQDRLKQLQAEQAAAVAAGTANAPAPTATPTPEAATAAGTTPAASPAEAASVPQVEVKPWYMSLYLWVGAGLLLIGGLVLALRRAKPKPDNGEPAPRRLSDDEALRASIAKTRAAGEKIKPEPAPPPVVVAAAAAKASAATPSAATPSATTDLALQALEAAVRERPQDLEAHLSLLRLHHSRGNAKQYEIAAQAMRARVPSTMDPRWREAVIMGASLAPGDSMFSQAGWNAPRFNEPESPTTATPSPPPPLTTASATAAAAAAVAAAASAAAAKTAAATRVTGERPAMRVPPPVKVFDEPVVEEISATAVDAERVGEIDLDEHADAFGDFGAGPADLHRSEAQLMVEDEASATRIELAKAYLAIGDLDGARSMLEEVLAEGGSMAQSEAARILKEIG